MSRRGTVPDCRSGDHQQPCYAGPDWVGEASRQAFSLRGCSNLTAMKIMSLKQKEEADSPEPAKLTYSDNHGGRVFDENAFRTVLSWERKRVERSERGFLLMLVGVESLAHANGGGGLLPSVFPALAGAMRETDVAGWYCEGTTLGVIFVELPRAKGSESEMLIRAKVMDELRAHLSPEHFNHLRFSFHFFPEDWTQASGGGAIDAKLYPDLLDRNEDQKWSRSVKRTLDIVGSALALAVLSPLLAAVAILIKLTSKGPILFRQERVGWYGSRFVLLKFRSMQCSNDPGIHREYVKRFIAGQTEAPPNANDKVVYKIQDDPRVTLVGRFLRRTSLDELPQFVNVLKGEMSLVGPRPPIPYELETYRLWHRRRVLDAKPGITGLWQVNGRSRIKFDEMVRLDLRYAKTWSLWTDLRILLRTPRAALFCEGAY